MRQEKEYQMIGAQALFRRALSLVGKTVEVGTRRDAKTSQGTIGNAMFDSFILQTAAGPRVILYADVVFLTESV
ncbi:MAG: hypothetical protein U0136_02105 [Bdellovibrionota bacterium]